MGTLSDVTAQATNTIKRRSNSSMGYQPLQSPAGMEKENLGQSKSPPHFMTPTFSSSKQSVATGTKSDDRVTTPVPAKPNKSEGNSLWMKSAAKRVGFRRHGGDGTPRSKKELHAKQPKTISFPDKFATPSRAVVSESSTSSREEKRALKVSPSDKPLPTPPVAQIVTSEDFMESKSLIDASDRPLRRSPSGSPDQEEDWPTLHPRRPSSPGTLQEMMHDAGTQLTQQAVPAQKERYPVLGNTLRQVPDEQIPVSRYSASYKVPRKEVSSSNLKKDTGENNALKSKKGSLHDPFRDGVYSKDLAAPKNRTSPSNLSSSAPAASGSAYESKSQIEPRQTRTSSLRARLSTGQIVNDGHSKVTGFTDFTAPKETISTASRRDSLSKRKETQGRRSTTPPIAPSLHNKPSRETLGASRAPAQFVAGSRRPIHPRRPSSRGSLRNEARASSPPVPSMPPSRAAPLRPDAGAGDPKKGSQPQAGSSTKHYTSSIPVSRKISSTATDHVNERFPVPTDQVVQPRKTQDLSSRKEARNEGGIYTNHSSQSLRDELDSTPPRTTTSRPAPFLVDNKDVHALEAIEESPQHAYALKRLSMHSPEYGPTLKISPAADRFIMGPSPSKEDRLVKKKSSKDLARAKMKEDLKSRISNTKPGSTTGNQPERPSSSQSLSRSGSRLGLLDRKARDKKAKSVDLSILSPKFRNPDQKNATDPSSSETVHVYLDAPKTLSNRSSDPFYDAPEEIPTEPIKTVGSDQTEDRQQSAVADDSWISPLNRSLVNKKSSTDVGNQSGKVTVKRISLEDSADPFQDNIDSQDVAQYGEDMREKATVAKLPSTPQKSNGKISTPSGSFPPRSSSRMAPPDWSSNKKSPTPPFAENMPPPTPPKDFPSRQNDLGSLRGHASSQIDFAPNQPTIDSWRDSAARDSYKSQASITKGNSVLSNLKGLFHKRSLENEPVKSTKGKPKSKVSITANGSPFPSMSDIHPVHRPTLSSTNRSKAPTPRPVHTPAPTAATPTFASPLPTEVSTTTTMALQILESARLERSSPKKERLLELGKIMVESITQARNAEKAMEEAKHAARLAEVAHALCRKSLNDVSRCVQEWKSDRSLNGKL